ncbi:hypothetical protein FP371_23280 [Citrobacter freundii]|uniref:hypothetical protein n=1 Tax=Gammaproteobacteria TaxID=1236 RepID=UPI0005CFA34B|nr:MULTISPECIES: hypothetical protein [Gammaproteobacteria]EEA2350406.1 hypothetical protein [Salmonella enterica subsp. enterica serovar Enteritidis]EEC4304184.1 hypothetical protein [Salmonella enterica subsp. enterica serovar Enteritidis]EEN2406608.1 hypothetical protein [Salmonella enterica subsp. enterica serovar Enteritidis]EES8921224.1 hypothetical protein [Escherichia coli]EES9863019.1 hypothetical protein [Escherichia coli]
MNRNKVVLLLLSTLAFQAYSITLTATDVQASDKIKYMQQQSGTDNSRLAAYIQADQTFTQWCGKASTIKDIKRISRQENFKQLYSLLKSGKMQGMTQTKSILLNDNPNFCKEQQ